MIRSGLVAALNSRRDNDVQVDVPLASGGYIRLDIEGVSYDPERDTILILAEEYVDDEDGAE